MPQLNAHLQWLEDKFQQHFRVLLPVEFFILGLAGLWVCLIGFYFPDLWWQLEEGLAFLKHGQFPQEPLGVFGIPKLPISREYLGYEAGIALIYKLGGLGLLRWFFIFLGLLLFGLPAWRTWSHVREETHSHPSLSVPIFFCLSLAVFFLMGRVQQRPEFVSNLTLMLWGWFLIERPRGAWKNILLPFAIMLVWANVHASFILGWGMAGLCWANQWWCEKGNFLAKTRNVLPGVLQQTAGLFLGTVFTPHGLARFGDPFILQGKSEWSFLVSGEMYPLSPLLYPFLLAAIVVTAWCLWKKGISRKHGWLLVMTLLGCALSVKSMRYTNVLGCLMLVNALAIKHPFRASPLWTFPVSTFVFTPINLSVIIALFPAVSKSLHPQPVKAAFAQTAFVRLAEEHSTPIPFLSEIRANSFAHWKHPQLIPLLDTGFNRFEQDTIRFYHYMDGDPRGLKLALEKLQVNDIVIGFWNSHWIFVLEQLPDWHLTDLTPDGAIYTRGKTDGGELALPEQVNFSLLAFAAMPTDKKKLNRLEQIPPKKWAGAFPFVLDWLKTVSEKDRRDALENILKIREPSPLSVLLAESLGDTALAKKQLPEIQDKLKAEIFYALSAKIFLSASEPEQAKKRLSDRRVYPFPQNQSMDYVEMRWQLGLPAEEMHFWNESTQAWMSGYADKLNQRINLLTTKPGDSPATPEADE